MKHSAPFKFKGAVAKEGEEGQKVYSAIASTDALDRDREVLLPKGCITENFLKNPVMLHIHDYRHVPVGKVQEIRIDKEKIEFDFEFADTEIGKEIEDMYIKGYMNAFSVGLYPLKSMWLDEESPQKFEVEVADGKKQEFDLSKYKIPPRRLVHQWELLEISPVPVPSNPEALLMRAKDNVLRKFMSDEKHSFAEGQLFDSQLSAQMQALSSAVKSFLGGLDTATIKNTVDAEATELDLESNWDAGKSRAALAKWASEDNSGDKDTIDWGKFAKGFAWVDTSKADKFTSYKYAHHTVRDGELVAVWKGVTSSLADLLSKKDFEDGAEVYAHLAEHYTTAGKLVPEYGKEYSEEELKAIEDDNWEDFLKAKESKPEETPTDVTEEDTEGKIPEDSEMSEEVLKAVREMTEQLQANLDEMEETIRLRMNILVNMVEELHQDVKSFNVKSEEEETPDPEGEEVETEDEKALNERFTALSGLLQGLGSSKTDDDQPTH